MVYRHVKEHLPGHKIWADFADGNPDFEAPLLHVDGIENFIIKRSHEPL